MLVCAWCQHYPLICFSARISLPTTFLFLTQSVFMLPTPCFSSFPSSPNTSPLTPESPLHSVLIYTLGPAVLTICFFFLSCSVFLNSSEVKGRSVRCVLYTEGTVKEDELHLLLLSPVPWWQHQAELTHWRCCCFQRCFHGRSPLCSFVLFSALCTFPLRQKQTSFFFSFLNLNPYRKWCTSIRGVEVQLLKVKAYVPLTQLNYL